MKPCMTFFFLRHKHFQIDIYFLKVPWFITQLFNVELANFYLSLSYFQSDVIIYKMTYA